MARPTTSAMALDAPEKVPSETILASLDTGQSRNSAGSTSLATPVEPSGETAEQPGIEPGTKTLGRIAVPTKNPQRAVESVIAAGEPAKEEKPVILAGLPLPVKSPRTGQNVPSAAVEKIVETAALEKKQAEPVAQMPARTISLDRYSAPEENTANIGQWALSSETTIADLADVQAPAYGRNIIRQVPGTILVQSFTPQLFGPGKNNFKGKAVTAMRFARLQIQ